MGIFIKKKLIVLVMLSLYQDHTHKLRFLKGGLMIAIVAFEAFRDFILCANPN